MSWYGNELREKIDDVIRLMQTDKKIDAIKELRAATGLGLKEAKDIVEAFYDYVQPNNVTYDQVPFEDPDQGEFGVLRTYSSGELGYVPFDTRAQAVGEARNFLENTDHTDVKVVKVVAKTKRTVEEI